MPDRPPHARMPPLDAPRPRLTPCHNAVALPARRGGRPTSMPVRSAAVASLRKIISGGQTGVDRAALDYAVGVGLPHGGNVPRGFAAQDGTIDRARYPGLVETPEADPDVRTKRNVLESDGTLVITKGPPDRGT